MYELEQLDGVVPEDTNDNHFSTLNKSSLQQYKLSLPNASNVASYILYNEFWDAHKESSNERAIGLLTNAVNTLIENTDINKTKTWKSSLSKFTDPVTLFQCSIPLCSNCISDFDYAGKEQLQKNNCKCNLGISEMVTNKRKGINESTKSVFLRNLSSENSSQESISCDDQKLFKPKFGWPRQGSKASNQPVSSKPANQSVSSEHVDIEMEKIEEENKTHNSNVAKITFKTAKEQLLATNPAAKRTLGASRKAQGKFVSPMIGVQEMQQKQESEEVVVTDERLRHLDPKMIELIESEIIDKGTPIGWDDIAGLQMAKSVIQEAVVWPLLRPDIFTGLRRPPKGILLFGPPGTGKTLIGKCVAAQCRATFFSISASSLTSKWIGDGEKMVRALFAVARCHQPAVIFIDEIDSLLTQRSDSEHEATRRIKTEFLVQFDGAATEEEDRVLIVGATNRPQELDEAARRRLVKRLYIPLPDVDARIQIISNLLKNENNDLNPNHISDIASLTEGYSGADMKSLCSEAAMGPIRSVPLSQIATIHTDKVRPVDVQDFKNALQRVRPSVSPDDLGQYVKWNKIYGQGF